MFNMEYATQPELGKCAKELRKTYRITQEQFAELLGVSRQTVINFENGSTQSMELLQGYIKLRDGII